jgi:hypothetical protein
MDVELLYRTKLQEIEREAQRASLVAAAKEAANRPAAPEAERRCMPIPSRLLRALRPSP